MNQGREADRYGGLDRFELEQQRIFRASWQFFGLEADLRRPGDYLSDVVAGFPVVVIRDTDGSFRGYHNVCPHRAGPLVEREKGRCDREFECPIHGWTFDFKGNLLEAPGYRDLAGFSGDALGLKPVRVDNWKGLLFITLDPTAGRLADELQPIDNHRLLNPDQTARLLHTHIFKCNWKIYVENFLWTSPSEGHVATHATCAHFHGRTLQGKPDEHWMFIWPNLALSLYRSVLLVEYIRPISPKLTEVNHLFLHAPEDPALDAALIASEAEVEHFESYCEATQTNIDTGVYAPSPFIRNAEPSVAWFDQLVASAVGD